MRFWAVSFVSSKFNTVIRTSKVARLPSIITLDLSLQRVVFFFDSSLYLYNEDSMEAHVQWSEYREELKNACKYKHYTEAYVWNPKSG